MPDVTRPVLSKWTSERKRSVQSVRSHILCWTKEIGTFSTVDIFTIYTVWPHISFLPVLQLDAALKSFEQVVGEVQKGRLRQPLQKDHRKDVAAPTF